MTRREWLLIARTMRGRMHLIGLYNRARGLATELAHHWGVPAESAACGTDSTRAATWQAGVEDALDLMLAAQEGSELLPSIGLVATCTVFEAEHLLLGDDIYHRVRHALLKEEVSDETLAVDVVADVGPGGHFLGHRHTRRHMRAAVVTGLTHVPAADGRGYRDAAEVARERALELIRSYEPEPLPEDQGAELTRILAAADAELRG